NVILVDLIEEPIQSILEQGVLTSRQVIEVDAIVYATGFDAMTGALNKIDIRGRQGLTLKQKWSEGPKTYLGIGSAGFPNLFMITGPGSPSVLTNMLPSIEQNVEWIAGCIGYLEQTKQQSIEATLEAEEAWVGEVNQLADQTLFPSCNSWYLGANIPGKPRVFMPYIGFPSYVEKCNQVVDEGYAGFDLR
ncbi:MAG TPA: cyclohexanone monooxygenase, partial [Gammaproteobacteria bacterium]|nr:cyclohexanone monooxygenase [Gammaproteobacteria bacterium]